jgi:hypothetical protein
MECCLGKKGNSNYENIFLTYEATLRLFITILKYVAGYLNQN